MILVSEKIAYWNMLEALGGENWERLLADTTTEDEAHKILAGMDQQPRVRRRPRRMDANPHGRRVSGDALSIRAELPREAHLVSALRDARQAGGFRDQGHASTS